MEDVDMLAFYVAILDTEEQKDKFTEIYTTYYGMMYQVRAPSPMMINLPRMRCTRPASS